MIRTQNSLSLMNRIDAAIQDVADIKTQLADTEQQLNTKLNILNTYYEITLNHISGIEDIEEKTRKIDTVVFAIDQDKIKGGEYSSYGQTIHPKLVGLSDQMFNFTTNTGPLYKDNAEVSFIYTNENNESIIDKKDEYCDLLKSENDPSKKDVFQTFQKNQLKLRVEIKPTKLIGNTYCNMLEICPYLPGSFQITGIRIWTLEQYLTNRTDEPKYEFDNIYKNVGAERIYLGDTYQIYRIEFDIEVLDQVQGFPFGLKHLYFYNAQMDIEDSYVVVEVQKGDSYINTIGNSVTLILPEGEEKTTALAQGIEYYAVYSNGVLQGSLSNMAPLARNLTSFYAKIPIQKSIKGISFNDIETR